MPPDHALPDGLLPDYISPEEIEERRRRAKVERENRRFLLKMYAVLFVVWLIYEWLAP